MKFPIATGVVSARLFGVRQILRWRMVAAKARAASEENTDSQFAASLRGKAKGYQEAIDLIEAVDKGRRLPSRRQG